MRLSRLSTSASRLVLLLLCVCVANFAIADEQHSPHTSLWAVQGKHNTLYLLGSMHLLPAKEQLPAQIDAAYRDSKTLVMEIDLSNVDPVQAQQLTMQLGLLPAGETLANQLGPEAAEKLETHTKQLGIPAAMLSQFKPWFAAITITQLQLFKMGLDPQSGVEQRFVAKAAADKKQIIGLETLEDQLGLLANLSPKLQKDFLLQTLEEADQVDQEINDMMAAWRSGDVAALEKYVARGMQEFPELYRPLTVDRNRRWLSRLEEMLGAEENYLVIVGALHLVGKDGVLDLLEKKGYKFTQE